MIKGTANIKVAVDTSIEKIVADGMGGGKCARKSCRDRHPKVCKLWSKSKSGFKRGEECDFLHVTLARSDVKVTDTDQKEIQEYKSC